jgi:hypothetical protein
MMGRFITEYDINTKLRLKVRSEKLEDTSKSREEIKLVQKFLLKKLIIKYVINKED